MSDREAENYSAEQLLRPYRSPHVFAIFDWKDPRPFLKKVAFAAPGIKDSFASAARSMRRRLGRRRGRGMPPQTPARIGPETPAVPGARRVPEDPAS